MMIRFGLLIMLLVACAHNAGCASTTFYGGAGVNIANPGVRVIYPDEAGSLAGQTAFETDYWRNPVGILGVRQPLGDHFELDYRHISSMGGHDSVSSDAVSFLFKFEGREVLGD